MMTLTATPIKQVKTSAAYLNDMTYVDYYNRLRSLALSVFKWTGLPESVNVRFLEQTLFDYGRALFFEDETLGFMALTCTPSGKLNVYREPVSFQAYSVNYNKRYTTDDSVLIRNNYDMIPTRFTLELFARRLYEAERTIDVNIQAQKTPYIITCDDKQRLTFKNLYAQVKGNEPVIFGNKSISLSDIDVLKTEAQFVADKLIDYKHDVMNEALTFLGLNNANTDKRERLIMDEVTANDQMISTAARVMLQTRQEAADKINQRYGLHISVEHTGQIERELNPDEPAGGETNE